MILEGGKELDTFYTLSYELLMKLTEACKIVLSGGYHIGDYEAYCFLGCNTCSPVENHQSFGGICCLSPDSYWFPAC